MQVSVNNGPLQKPKALPFKSNLRELVKAGKKTTTRRPLNPQPTYAAMTKAGLMVSDGPIFKEAGLMMTSCGRVTTWPKMPYRPGQILYVPEPWKCPAIIGEEYVVKFQDGESVTVHFDDPERFHRWSKYIKKPQKQWQSPYFMPWEAARTFLEVTHVGVERLLDITNAGAKAEGFKSHAEFISSWAQLYGNLATANPWVLVVDFRQIPSGELCREFLVAQK